MDKSDGSGWLPLSRRSALGTLAGAVGIGAAGCLFDNDDESDDPDGGNESMSGEPPETDYSVGDRTGIQALDANADRKRYRGYHVDHSCAVSVDSGDLGTEDTLAVDAGRYFVAGEPQDLASAVSVGIDAAPSPGSARWDVVHGTESGVEITAGTEEGTRPSDAQRRGVERPAPPQVTGTVLAWIWVSSESGTITDDDVIDRRLFGHSRPASVETNSLTVGEGVPYPYVTNGHATVSVPGDYPTIQAAVDAAPKRLRHEYIIDVDDGHGEGHIKIQGHSQEGLSTGNRGYGTAGENYQLQILGNRDDPSQVQIDSLTVVGCVGVEMPQIWGVQLQGSENPDVDESSCVNVSGSTEAFLGNCNFRNPTDAARYAAQAFNAGAHFRMCDFGNSVFEHAIFIKRDSDVTTTDLSGSTVNEELRYQQSGSVYQRGTTVNDDQFFRYGGVRRRQGRVDIREGDQSRGTRVSLQGSAQSIPGDGTWTGVSFDAVEWNDLGTWDGDEWVAPEAGVYQVNFNALFISVPDGTRVGGRINQTNAANTRYGFDQRENGVAGGEPAVTPSTAIKLAAGDRLLAEVKQDSGSPLDIYNNQTTTAIDIHKL